MIQSAIVKKQVREGVVEVSLLRQVECGLSCGGNCAGCTGRACGANHMAIAEQKAKEALELQEKLKAERAAKAAAKGIAAVIRGEHDELKSLQEYHASIPD